MLFVLQYRVRTFHFAPDKSPPCKIILKIIVKLNRVKQKQNRLDNKKLKTEIKSFENNVYF